MILLCWTKCSWCLVWEGIIGFLLATVIHFSCLVGQSHSLIWCPGLSLVSYSYGSSRQPAHISQWYIVFYFYVLWYRSRQMDITELMESGLCVSDCANQHVQPMFSTRSKVIMSGCCLFHFFLYSGRGVASSLNNSAVLLLILYIHLYCAICTWYAFHMQFICTMCLPMIDPSYKLMIYWHMNNVEKKACVLQEQIRGKKQNGKTGRICSLDSCRIKRGIWGRSVYLLHFSL